MRRRRRVPSHIDRSVFNLIVFRSIYDSIYDAQIKKPYRKENPKAQSAMIFSYGVTMTTKLTNLPVNALSEIMGKLSLKDATVLGTVSKHTRAALDRVHPDRYKGPPDYTKGKGKYQKEYDGMHIMIAEVFEKETHKKLTKKQDRNLHRQFFLHQNAFQKAQEAYAKGHLVYTMTRYWKKAANLKEVYQGVLKKLKSMGKAYEPAIQALKKKQSKESSDETQAHKIMDAVVKYIPQFVK
jgi:hypothetical protein